MKKVSWKQSSKGQCLLPSFTEPRLYFLPFLRE